MSFKEKYLKYKLKYLNLKKKLRGGAQNEEDIIKGLNGDEKNKNEGFININLEYTDASPSKNIDVDPNVPIKTVLIQHVDMNEYDVSFGEEAVSPDENISNINIQDGATLTIIPRPIVELRFQQYDRGGVYQKHQTVVQHTGNIPYPRDTGEIIWTTVKNYKLRVDNIKDSIISSIYKKVEHVNATSASGMHDNPLLAAQYHIFDTDKWSKHLDIQGGSTLIINIEPEVQSRHGRAG